MATQVAQAIPRSTSRPSQKPRRQPPYQVVLWDDEDHSYAYVIEMLAAVFGCPPERGYQMAEEVDTRGQVVVLTTTMEHAELKRDQILAYGKDRLIVRCEGSMSATIEPAE